MDKVIKKKRFTLKKILSVGVPAALVLVLLYVFIFGDKSSRYIVNTERITISTVTKGEFLEYTPCRGTVLPIKSYQLSATEGGMVEERIVDAGTMVKEGDPIVRMSNTNLLLTILNNQANVNRAANDLRSTKLAMQTNMLRLKRELATINFDLLVQKRDYEKSKQLFEKNLVAKNEFELKRDQYKFTAQSLTLIKESMYQDSLFRENQRLQLEQSLEQMKENLNIVRKRKEALTLRAPISGMLTSLDAEIGVTKNQGETIGRIDVLDSLKVRCPIDQNHIARVEVGKAASFKLNDQVYRLKVSKVFPEVRDGSFDIDLIFVGDVSPEIRRGQNLSVSLELGDLEEAILLPQGGHYSKTGGQWVYLLDESETFAVKQPVSFNRKNPEYYTVASGLKPGDKVITSPYEVFGDADKLILKK